MLLLTNGKYSKMLINIHYGVPRPNGIRRTSTEWVRYGPNNPDRLPYPCCQPFLTNHRTKARLFHRPIHLRPIHPSSISDTSTFPSLHHSLGNLLTEYPPIVDCRWTQAEQLSLEILKIKRAVPTSAKHGDQTPSPSLRTLTGNKVKVPSEFV